VLCIFGPEALAGFKGLLLRGGEGGTKVGRMKGRGGKGERDGEGGTGREGRRGRVGRKGGER